MRYIAITGGIGSGKSYVCGLLNKRGIAVYDCDAAAKRLMSSDSQLQDDLAALVGQELYEGGILQKAILARYLLESDAHKCAVNDVVHPAVARDFLHSGMEWLESAILFDSGFDRRVHFDYTVCVSAPLEVRISRVMARDHISRENTLEWIGRQMPQEEVEARADAVILNDGQADLDSQINQIINTIKQY